MNRVVMKCPIVSGMSHVINHISSQVTVVSPRWNQMSFLSFKLRVDVPNFKGDNCKNYFQKCQIKKYNKLIKILYALYGI